MKKGKTADEIYLKLKDILQEDDTKDKDVYGDIEKICGKQHGIGISAEGVETIKNEYLKYKTERNMDAFLKRVFEIANDEGIYSEQYEDIKFVATLRETIRDSSFKPTFPIEDAQPSYEIMQQEKPKEKRAQNGGIRIEEWNALLAQITPSESQEWQEGEKQGSKETVKKDVPVQKNLENIKTIDLQTDNDYYEVIRNLCLNGRTLNELTINGIPIDIIKNVEKYIELRAILSILKAKTRELLEISNKSDRIEESMQTVLDWILGEKPNTKNSIIYRENRVIRAINAKGSATNFEGIRNECFKNSDGVKETAVMVFILERLKRERGLRLTENNNDYKNDKEDTKKTIEILIKLATLEKGRTFTD